MKKEDILNIFMEEFPDIMKTINTDDEGIYCVLSDFGLYLRDGVINRTISEKELDRIYKILNLMGQSGDPEIQNQLVVGILEIQTDNNESKRVARQRLKGAGLALFENLFTDGGFQDT